jgi:oligopeptide transport system substrate-binding protein
VKVSVFDPQKISESHEFDIAIDLFEGLTAISASGKVIPGVASRWTTSKDGLVWTFFLRPNARWSNGEPVTAEDFVYSFRREVSPLTASPSAEALSRIAGAESIRLGKTENPAILGVSASDRRTLRVVLTAPTPWLPMLLTHFAAMPVPRSQISRYGDEWTRPGRMVGNGAYTLAGLDANGTIHLKQNPFFHDAGSVKVPRVTLISGLAPADALKRFDDGDFDVVTLLASSVSQATSEHPGWILKQSELATRSLIVNPNKGLLSDPRFRRALSSTIDREELIQTVEHATYLPAYELVAPGLAGYRPQSATWSSEPLAERISQARALMVQLPGAPVRVSLTFRDGPAGQRVASAIAEGWKMRLGVETTLVPLDGKTFLERLGSHDFELAVVGWDPDFADASNYLDGYRCDAGAANFGAYCDRDFDKFMTAASSTIDPSARMRLLESAERRLIDADAVMPIAHGLLEFVVSPRLKGWEASPLSRHPSRFLSIQPRPAAPARRRI